MFFLLCCSNNVKIGSEINDFTLIQGIWVNQIDKKWKLTFKGNIFHDIYDEEFEECTFTIKKESCNKEYTKLDASFLYCLCEEDLCLEILSLTQTKLTYRETISGKMHTFNKK